MAYARLLVIIICLGAMAEDEIIPIKEAVGICVDEHGGVFYTDGVSSAWRYDPKTKEKTRVIDGLKIPTGIVVLPGGDLIIAETNAYRVIRVKDGKATTIIGTSRMGYTTDAGKGVDTSLTYPVGLAYDKKRKHLYVADAGARRIRRMDEAGNVTVMVGAMDKQRKYGTKLATLAPVEQVKMEPLFLALDEDGTTLFYGDCLTRQVVKTTIGTTGGLVVAEDPRKLGDDPPLGIDVQKSSIMVANGKTLLKMSYPKVKSETLAYEGAPVGVARGNGVIYVGHGNVDYVLEFSREFFKTH
jgi:hypothetical protein